MRRSDTTGGMIRGACALLLLCVAGAVHPASGQHQEQPGHELGRVDFAVSCKPEVQSRFDEAVALLHHMTYPEARQAFERIAAADSLCAMAHWGIAMTLFQPLWPTRPGPGDLTRGWEAVQRARALGPKTERERRFVDAAAAFFREPAGTDYWLRIRRWEQAMQQAYTALPRDPEVAAFYALAHLATTPATEVTRTHADRAAEILLPVYRANPDHPGAMHYLIHANDVPGRERELLDIVRKYETAAPRNPHALHMPTHVYLRLGDWERVIRGNQAAAEAALEHPAGDRGQFVWDEFPHAIEYLVYGYLQQGADADARAQLARLEKTPRLQPSFKTAFHLSSTRARFALERQAWAEARELPVREPAALNWDQFQWPEAVTWFARGLGAVHSGDTVSAKAAIDRLFSLARATAAEPLFARSIGILRLSLSAWLAHATGHDSASTEIMRAAADLEVSTPKHAVTPGPTLPVHEQLGDLLMAQGRPAEALAAYRRSLELYPRRFNSLLGAARAARDARDSTSARAYYRELLQVASPTSKRAGLDEARGFAGRSPEEDH